MAKPKRKNSSKSSSGLKPFILGLIVGASGMFLYVGVIQDNRPTTVGSGLKDLIAAATEAEKAERQVAAVESATPQPKDPTDGFTFNFYDVLLEDEYILPHKPESKQDAAAVPQPEQPESIQDTQEQTEKPATTESFYVLQAGSYKVFDDADKLKARLALAGHSSYIQKVTIEGRGDYFRVRLGPFDTLGKMRATNTALAGMGIKTISFKMKGKT